MEYDGKFIILHRWPDKSEGDKWGLPAGKVDSGESDVKAILREIKEETGYEAKEEELEFLKEWVRKYPEKIVEFPVFRIKLKENIEVVIQPNEHSEFRWVTPEECYAMKDMMELLYLILEEIGYVKKQNNN